MGQDTLGASGLSPLARVVGADVSVQARRARELMPNGAILVSGNNGAQGDGAAAVASARADAHWIHRECSSELLYDIEE